VSCVESIVTTETEPNDATMQRASEALARMDYLACEALCLDALRVARDGQQWADYARILMPLQEARRQRRMIAAEGMIRLGTATHDGALDEWLNDVSSGCIVVTRPHGQRDAHALFQAARSARKHVEVLWADCDMDAPQWLIRTFVGPDATCRLDAPPTGWVDTNEPDRSVASYWPTPGDWFLDAAERLGDAALETVDPQLIGADRVAALEARLDATADHEILHQRLFDTARAIR